MHKNRIWLIFGPIAIGLFLASCQSSRFMQDDMYFSETDAIREVREFENARLYAKLNKNEDPNSEETEIVEANEDYYDYSYTSRLRRFNTDDNTWGYYDPYYTNYYWYNNSNTSYFGNSLYTTYNWWSPSSSNNYNSRYGGYNNYNVSVWKVPYNKYVSNSWNTGPGYTNMYYNSFDNNCYSKYNRFNQKFSALMQKNGIQRNVFERPEINYTALRESKVTIVVDTNEVLDITLQGSTPVFQNADNSSNKSNTNTKTTSNTINSNNSTTTKRWDNHNADLNITPNSNKSEENTSRTSRSGVYSEGSRNNNYVYKGSAIQNKGSNNNGGTQNKGKDPNK